MKLKKPRFWDYKKPNIFAILLWPLTIVIKLNNFFKFKKINKYNDIKTICIGNIYVGGTGKTSLAIKLKEILEKKQFKVCFIKKFYKNQVDEVRLLEKHGKVFIKKKRTNALMQAINEKYDIAIFDDGLQDKSITYDIRFVCFNGLNWIGNGLLIPAGPLRETIKSLRFYENVVLNGYNENLENIKNQIKNINSNINIFESRYVHLNNEIFNKNEKYIVFSGIGNHQTFLKMLKLQKFNILKDLEFPDHYNYTDIDLNKIYNLSKQLNAHIITTEKDFLRLDKSKTKNIQFIKSDLKIIETEKIIKALIN
jgi:tetraacyldisaccharide 4'-kinase